MRIYKNQLCVTLEVFKIWYINFLIIVVKGTLYKNISERWHFHFKKGSGKYA